MSDIFNDLNYKLTKNFKLSEFKVSSDYPELAAAIEFSELEVTRLKMLCTACLQPLRDKMGRIDILSGKRSDELNVLVGGSSISDHKTSNAADLDTKDSDVEHVYRWIVEESGIPYRQVIFYPSQKFIHISVNIPCKPERHEALVKIDAGVYCSYSAYYSQK